MARSHVRDAALALGLAVLAVAGTAGAGVRTDADRPIDPAGYALVAAAALALAARRRAPLPTLAVVTVLCAGYLAVGYPYGPVLVLLFVALFTVARHVPARPAGIAAALAFVALMVHVFTNDAAFGFGGGLGPVSAWVVVPFALGSTLRLNAEAKLREREDLVRRGVAEERLRVAQEVHDVVGHGLVAITMQANVALHLMDRDPQAAVTALTAISRSSGEALDELRSTLGLISAAPEVVPGPGLARVPELVRRMSAAGMRVDLSVVDAPALPAAADLAAYRVLQEALTNVLRHSDARTARVTIGPVRGGIAVEVTNPRSPSAVSVEGVGIAGMRSRVGAAGGTLEVGPLDGEFRVGAWLPGGAS